MPDAPHQQCRHPRCPNYAVRYGCCIEHAPNYSLQPTYNGLNSSNKRFRKLRHSYLLRHPFCVECDAVVGLSGVVDHRIPHRGDATLFWSQSNWQTLCVTCHGRKTATETLDVNALSKAPWRGPRAWAQGGDPGTVRAIIENASRPLVRSVPEPQHVGGSFVLRPRGDDSSYRLRSSLRGSAPTPGGCGKSHRKRWTWAPVEFLRPRYGNRGE